MNQPIFPTLLERFFTQRLMQLREASGHTILGAFSSDYLRGSLWPPKLVALPERESIPIGGIRPVTWRTAPQSPASEAFSSLFLLVGHAGDSPEVRMAVDQARNQIQVGAVEPLYGTTRPARRSGACRAEDALDPPVMNRHSDAVVLPRTLRRDDRNVLNAQVLGTGNLGMHYWSKHQQADRTQSPDASRGVENSWLMRCKMTARR
jgi:hypothetical protein